MMQKIILFLMALHSVFMTSAQVTTIALNDNWRFKPATPKLEKGLTEDWIKVKAPCLVHSALIENKIIPDLFYRDNETKYQWIEREDWVFENQFEVPAQWLMQDHVELNFKGLDTYADVFLNGELILKADNAFRSWQIDVKPHLREGVNFLRIFFYAAVKMDEENREIHGYALPGIPTNERVFSRKPQFHYGWDWGPRFVNVGIWRGVELNLWSTYRLKEMNIVQKKISQSEALIQSDFVVESDVEKEVKITFNIDNQSIEKQFNLRKGINQLFFANVKIPNPKLWWSRDLGEPHRYRITLSDGMQQLEQYVGLRTIELVREKDKKGETFYFRLNGVPVFAKGANYIPLNIFQDKVSASHYAEMIENAAQANMNMLRVWGGGIYENDEFYECCDKAGIMVWQDFMFACAMYPANKPFLQNIENEAIENIKRLRHHPCIALWCGNNEISEAWHNWGWQELFLLHPKRKAKIWNDYEEIFKKRLPNLVKIYGNAVDYWESSPSFSRFHEKSDIMGDSHYWGVWHDEEPFEQYAKRVPRFMSEYGFQSFPEWKTIQSFTTTEDRGLETPVMNVHQKHPRGNTLMRKYMAREYHVPEKFEDFTYVSQIVQAEGIRRGVEAHRRAKPYCMGTLYWQLNDVWPVASWSSIDGLGNWKALHYAVKKAFSPLLLSMSEQDGFLSLILTNDFLSAYKDAKLKVQLIDFQGNEVFQTTESIALLNPNANTTIFQTTTAKLLHGKSSKSHYALFTLIVDNKILSCLNYYFECPKKLSLTKEKLNPTIEQIGTQYHVTFRSETLIKNLFLQTEAKGKWQENYVDLLPNESKTIIFDYKEGVFEASLQWKCLNDFAK